MSCACVFFSSLFISDRNKNENNFVDYRHHFLDRPSDGIGSAQADFLKDRQRIFPAEEMKHHTKAGNSSDTCSATAGF